MLSGCPHDAFHMVVDLCEVFAHVRQGDEKVRLLG